MPRLAVVKRGRVQPVAPIATTIATATATDAADAADNGDLLKKLELSLDVATKQKTESPKSELSFIRKLLFGFAAPPSQMSTNVVGFYFNIFMLEVAKLPPSYVSIILFIGRAWDAITDPLVGHLVTKTDTKFGQTKPWMVVATPLGCLTFFMLWLAMFPVASDYDGGKFVYYLATYLLFCTCITCYHVPYTSSTMLIARLSQDKDQATAFRMSFELLGTIVGVGLFGIITNSKRIAANCGTTPQITEEAVDAERWAYVIGAIVIVAIYLACGVAAALGIKEKYKDPGAKGDGFFVSMKAVLTFKPYLLLMLAFLFMSLGVQMVQTNLALYTTHSLELGSHTSFGILCVLGIAILAIPFWMRMSDKFGKKNIFAFGIVLFIPCLISAMLVPPGVVWAYYLVMSLSGLAISIAMLLPWSMLPDVIDDYYLKHNVRREASFYSLYVFFNKFAVGFSMAASQVTLSLVRYDSSPNVCEQSHSVGTALRYLLGPGPILCLLISLALIYMYPIDKRYRQELSENLRRRIRRQDSADQLDVGNNDEGNSTFDNAAFNESASKSSQLDTVL